MTWPVRAVKFLRRFASNGCKWVRRRRRSPPPSPARDGGAADEQSHLVEHASHHMVHKLKDFFKLWKPRRGEVERTPIGHQHLASALERIDHPLRRSCWIGSSSTGDADLVFGPLGLRRPSTDAKLRFNALSRRLEWYIDVPAAATGQQTTGAAGGYDVAGAAGATTPTRLHESSGAAAGGSDRRGADEHGGLSPN